MFKKKEIVIVVILLLLLPLIFLFPRIDMTIKTLYSESLLSTINIDIKIENHAFIDVNSLSVTISILNESDDLIAEKNFYKNRIALRSTEKFENLQFRGSQLEIYHIIISIEFYYRNEKQEYSFTHTINDEYMNQKFEDRVFR
ncbi:MAG: hypothetical protein AB1779_08750, partial [Candidatus Thermoplasmatota archaeon]